MSGPVISVSRASGGVTSEMPASRAGPEIWPPWPALVAEYVCFAVAAGLA